MHDHLRLVAPTEIPRLLKVRAEKRMSEVIILGAIASAAFNTALLTVQFSTYRLVFDAFLVLVILSSWRSAERRLKNFTNGTIIMWLMHATQGPFPLPQGNGLDEKSEKSLPNQPLKTTKGRGAI